jgi:hypothetical protein
MQLKASVIYILETVTDIHDVIICDIRRSEVYLDILVPEAGSLFLHLKNYRKIVLAVSKQIMNRVCTERFNLKKLNEVEDKEQYRVEISNSFTALENLGTEMDINRTIRN